MRKEQLMKVQACLSLVEIKGVKVCINRKEFKYAKDED